MRSILYVIGSVIFTIILIPMILVQSCDLQPPKIEKQAVVESDKVVRVYVSEKRKIITLDLEEYIKGVVAGEMPAAFEEEALKAQAVAARSYAEAKITKYKEGGHPQHPGAELCDTTHCQVWYSTEKLREIKSKYWMKDYWPKIEKIVEDTKGLVMTYQGTPIEEPLFHSTSGGRTENSEDVFASEVPYLRSVESPYEEKAPYLTDAQMITASTFISKVKAKYKDVVLKENALPSQMKILERSDGGRIMKIQVGNKEMTGREVRDLLGLRSANFKITIKGNNLEFTTFGNGHGVGMSQWGANGMAEKGHSFEEILKHYYVGVKVEKMK